MSLSACPAGYGVDMGKVLIFGAGILIGMILLPILILQAIF